MVEIIFGERYSCMMQYDMVMSDQQSEFALFGGRKQVLLSYNLRISQVQKKTCMSSFYLEGGSI